MKITKGEVLFGLAVLGIVAVILFKGVSLHGYVIAEPTEVTLISPSNGFQTTDTNTYFIFGYSDSVKMAECMLYLNDEPIKATNSLLSPYNTRIRVDLKPGTYSWKISCKDETGDETFSGSRKLIIGEQANPELQISAFANKAGRIYSFKIHPGLSLQIEDVMPNDEFRAAIGESNYEIQVIRLIEDYAAGTEHAELVIMPGYRRVNVNIGESKGLDLNNDLKEDMILTLKSITYRKAVFIVDSLPEDEIETPSIQVSADASSEPKSIEQPAKIVLDLPSAEKSKGISIPLLMELFLLVVIAAIAINIFQTARAKKHQDVKAHIVEEERKLETEHAAKALPSLPPVKKAAKKHAKKANAKPKKTAKAKTKRKKAAKQKAKHKKAKSSAKISKKAKSSRKKTAKKRR